MIYFPFFLMEGKIMANIDWGVVVIAGVMALSNLGGVAFLAKRYFNRVDKHDETMPAMVESIEALKESAVTTSKCLEDLFLSRLKFTELIARIEERVSSQTHICDERWGSGDHPKRRWTDTQ